MMLKFLLLVGFVAAAYGQAATNDTVDSRYGGARPGRPGRPARPQGFRQPGNQGAGFAQVGNLGFGQPGFGQPGSFVNQPGGFVQPGFGQPGFGQPGFGQSGGFVQPGINQPGSFVQPGFGQPGFGQTGGFVQPGGIGTHTGLVNPTGVAGVHSQTLGASGALQYNCQASASQGAFGIGATCKEWCKLPVQIWGGKFACCEDRVGQCPPIRAECPRYTTAAQFPSCCFVDSQCQIPTHKCCFDKCLGHKVCKEAYQNRLPGK